MKLENIYHSEGPWRAELPRKKSLEFPWVGQQTFLLPNYNSSTLSEFPAEDDIIHSKRQEKWCARTFYTRNKKWKSRTMWHQRKVLSFLSLFTNCARASSCSTTHCCVTLQLFCILFHEGKHYSSHFYTTTFNQIHIMVQCNRPKNLYRHVYTWTIYMN